MFNINAIPFSWRDVLDVAVVTILLYYLIRFVRGTRAIAALHGLMLLLMVYVAAQVIGLYTLVWLLENIFGSLFLVIVILFHTDIRQALSNLSFRSLFRRKSVQGYAGLIETLANTASALAKKRIGAIIVIQMSVPLGDVMEKGVLIDAVVSQDLLNTIFFPNTTLHDGAVIVNLQGRIVAAGCVLPLAQMGRQHFGTRHRAALGISEVSDALAITVSEERGEVTIARGGQLSPPLNHETFVRILTDALIS